MSEQQKPNMIQIAVPQADLPRPNDYNATNDDIGSLQIEQVMVTTAAKSVAKQPIFAQASSQAFSGMLLPQYGKPKNSHINFQIQSSKPPNLVTGIPVSYEQVVVNPQGHILSTNAMLPDPTFVQRMALESDIRRMSRYFTGCNICWGVLLVISIITSALGMHSTSTGDTAKDSLNSYIQSANKIFIAEYSIWLCGIFVGVVGICRFQTIYFEIYKYALVICVILQIVGSIVEFSGFGGWQGGSKVVAVIVLILIILVQYFFIKKSTTLRSWIKEYRLKYLMSSGQLVQQQQQQMQQLQVIQQNNNLEIP